MDLTTITITAIALVLAAVLDLGLLRWLRRRRSAPPSEDHAPVPAKTQALPRLLGQLRIFLTPLPSEKGVRPSAPPEPVAKGALIPSFLRYLRIDVLRQRSRRFRLCLALAGLAASTAIGLRFSGSVMVQGWQLWAWIAALALTSISLMPARWPALPRGLPWGWLGGLLVVGFFLRAAFLETIPGRLHPDEAGLALYTQIHVFPRPGLTVSPFVTGSVSQPTLHSYILSLALAAAGKSITGLRLPSVIAGTLGILATYAAIAAVDNRRTALLAAAVMTTYHYHIHWSRLALNNIWDTLWVPLVLAAFAWGWKRRWSGGAVLAGLALGLSQYFYAGSKVAILLLGLLIFKLWRQEPDRRRLGVHLGKLVATAFCAAVPIGLFALRNPEVYFARIPQVIGWYPEAAREITGSASGWWGYLWYQTTHSLGAYLIYSDITGFYGPGIAFTFGVSALAFVLGVLWAIRTRRWLPLAWVLLTAFLGGFVLLVPPSSSHYVASIPGIAWLVALPLDALIARGWGKLAVVFLAAIMISDLIFYFGVYVPRGAPHLSVPFPTPALPQSPPG